MISLLEVLGVKAELDDTVLRLDPSKCDGYEAPYDLVRKMRASIYVLWRASWQAWKGKSVVPRWVRHRNTSVDLHLMGLEKLGAKISIEHGYIIAEADKLVGTEIYLAGIHGPSVGATVNVILAAVKADGITTIRKHPVNLR